MSIKLATLTSLFTIGAISGVFAAPLYDDSYVKPVRVAPPAAVHYSMDHTAPRYSSDYTNNDDGFKPVPMQPARKVDYNRLAQLKLPPCQTPEELAGPQAKAGDGGASHTDACKDMRNH
jgi:hypothetical protein